MKWMREKREVGKRKIKKRRNSKMEAKKEKENGDE